jgi:acyl carrier protein
MDKVMPHKIRREASFQELGLDSLDTMEFIVDTEEKLSVELTDEEVLNMKTVMDAINIFMKHKRPI